MLPWVGSPVEGLFQQTNNKGAPGLMKRLHSCVPRGTRPMMYSAPTMASTYERGVRDSVDTATTPPGRVSLDSAAMKAGASFTCSITSEATTASYCAPLKRASPLFSGEHKCLASSYHSHASALPQAGH